MDSALSRYLPTPDRDVVVQVAAGDPEALAELRRRHDSTLYALAYGVLGDALDAAHVVSETFLQAARAARQFDPDLDRVPAWLAAITRQRARIVLDTRTPPMREEAGVGSEAQ